jgi:Rod binding domain-containing protein
MAPVDPTSSLGTQPLTPPPGVKLDTPEQQELYRASLEFERVFVQQMLKPMKDAGSMFDDGEGTGSTSGYEDMAQDQMTQAVLDGGGLGMAATIYQQMADAAGILKATKAGETTNTSATPAPTNGAAS